MTSFPILRSLEITGYSLYPGEQSRISGFRLNTGFGDGPWIVLGVNGLGKSTLLLLLKHLLIGPVRARDAGFSGDRSDLVGIDSRFFAVRVPDGAANAKASLTFNLGGKLFSVTRRLSDQTLIAATCNATDIGTSESSWRSAIAEGMALDRFEDAVRVIDRIVFKLESSPSLIWDVSAQFEIFRALLTPNRSLELRRLEAEIVSNDSAARNLNATIFKMSQRRDRQLQLLKGSADTQAEIASVSGKLDKARSDEQRGQLTLEASEVRLSDARVRQKRAERDLDARVGAYEDLKFKLLRHAFAGVKPSDQYVFLKLLAEQACLACGNTAPQAAEELARRQSEGLCLVCGSPRHPDKEVVSTTSALKKKATIAFDELEKARAELKLADEEFSQAESARDAAAAHLEQRRTDVDRLAGTLRRLHRKLPAKDRAELAREEDNIERLRREVLRFRKERSDAEDDIASLLEELTVATVAIRTQLEASFLKLSQDFFAEQLRLVYAPRRDRIGQAGRVFEFPAFEIEMTSGATAGEFVRRNVDQVSLSQREYLDITFRMSLLETLSGGGCSLLVDGPEGSLDSVFSGRAGQLFSDFAAHSHRNVILACNIIDGAFLPKTLSAFKGANRKRQRLVNLMELSAPTAALKSLKREYESAVTEVLAAKASKR
ncbi:MAG: hypothetical protein E5X72_29055 [Mesorhizobium sp.]|uniref:hypothetical protein n=1 Tax=Mesorhizobium sp. TaxID=1871066 RepID=UPI00122391F7|nr:hypothetical protein [Mesorhizobium sp.]TIP00656.1 MAG: hypothetical protein E5X72_29055 [Mesorhizobium sp.]